MYLCSMGKMLMVTVAEAQLILNGSAGPIYSVVPLVDATSRKLTIICSNCIPEYNFSLVAFATGVKVPIYVIFVTPRFM